MLIDVNNQKVNTHFITKIEFVEDERIVKFKVLGDSDWTTLYFMSHESAKKEYDHILACMHEPQRLQEEISNILKTLEKELNK